MYDILDLYEEPYDPSRPIVNLDEKPKQLLADKRKTIPMKPGKPERHDYEYVRKGTANIFVAAEIKAGKRITKVTRRRTREDYAQFIKDLVDGSYQDATKIRIIQDNLNTHNAKSLYVTFEEEEAKRILNKIEFHYTPKHASWLNAAEIEINVMDIECTGDRIGTIEKLSNEVLAWTKRRNDLKRRIQWQFTKDMADEKLAKHYV